MSRQLEIIQELESVGAVDPRIEYSCKGVLGVELTIEANVNGQEYNVHCILDSFELTQDQANEYEDDALISTFDQFKRMARLEPGHEESLG